MGVFTNTGKNNMLGAVGITHVAAFDGEPGNGGSQVGSRESITLGSASNGTRAATNQPAISITGGNSVDWLAYYDAATGGNLLAKDDIPTEAFGSDGTLTVTSAEFSITDS